MYTCIPSFLDFLPIYVTKEHWVEFTVLYGKFSLVIYFIHGNVYPSIQISQFVPLPSRFPPWYPYDYSLCLSLLCFVNKIIYTKFFRFQTYVLRYNICFSISDFISIHKSLQGISITLYHLWRCSTEFRHQLSHSVSTHSNYNWCKMIPLAPGSISWVLTMLWALN